MPGILALGTDIPTRHRSEPRARPGPAREMVFRRWREVEAHHVDLGLGYGWADWPDELVQRWLPSLLTALPHRAGGHALVAWTTGRGPAPALPPWG